MRRLLRGLVSASCVIAVLTTAASADEPCPGRRLTNDRVVGKGSALVPAGQHKFQAFLFGAQRCGGTLVSPTAVMTAAHCVTLTGTKTKVPENSLTVRVGTINALAGGEFYCTKKCGPDKVDGHVSKITIADAYNPKTTENDIAIVELSAPSKTPTVPLDGFGGGALGETQLAAARATILGWGRVDPEEDYLVSDALKYGVVPIMTKNACPLPAIMGANDGRRLCAGGEGMSGADTCQGDSGGPLLIGNGASVMQVGVLSASTAEACGRKGVFGTYTRVSAYKDFISRNVHFASRPSGFELASWSPRAAAAAGPSPQSGLGAAGTTVATSELAPANLTRVSVWLKGEYYVPVTEIPGVDPATSESSADYVWDPKAGLVWRKASPGSHVAEDVQDLSKLAGVLSKWRTLPTLLGNRGNVALSVALQPPRQGPHLAGEKVNLVVKRTSAQPQMYLTLFDLTSDGSIDYLYPDDGLGEGSGAWRADTHTVADVNVKCPFGVDHLVAIATSEAPNALRDTLKELQRLRQPVSGVTTSALKKSLTGTYGVSVVEFFTKPK